MLTLKMMYVAFLLLVSSPFPTESSLPSPRALEQSNEAIHSVPQEPR